MLSCSPRGWSSFLLLHTGREPSGALQSWLQPGSCTLTPIPGDLGGTWPLQGDSSCLPGGSSLPQPFPTSLFGNAAPPILPPQNATNPVRCETPRPPAGVNTIITVPGYKLLCNWGIPGQLLLRYKKKGKKKSIQC